MKKVVDLGQFIFKGSGMKFNGSKPSDIQINRPSFILRSLFGGSLSFGDSYARGDWDVERIDLLFEKIVTNRVVKFKTVGDFIKASKSFLINTQAGKRAFSVGQRHYDLGNDMYELMLGESMTYSSALFENKNDTLTQAQENKYRSLCESLDLKPGMKILEIGSGWGAFAKFAASNYKVHVTGLTVSKEQKAYAEKLCKGLQTKFLLKDYLTIKNEFNGKFDRVVSIEMIEAVGKKNFKKYFDLIERVLKQDGIAGIQAILGNGKVDWFASTRIFPNGLVPSMGQIVSASEKKLTIDRLKSFGVSYAKTLQNWEKNFSKHWMTIAKIRDKDGRPKYDERFRRMWRYYLLSCAGAFNVGYIDVAQIVFKKSNMFDPVRHNSAK